MQRGPGRSESELAVKRLFSKPVELNFQGGQVRLKDAAEFERLLSKRAAPTPNRVASLSALAPQEREQEAVRMERSEHQILRALALPPDAQGSDGPASAPGSALSGIDLKDVPDDNDWRAIIFAVQSLNPPRDDFAKVALGKLASYLANCRELLQALSGGGQFKAEGALVWGQVEDHADTAPRQRLTFNLDHLAAYPIETADAFPGGGLQAGDNNFARVPKGEAVQLTLKPHQSIDLMLARYRFHLVMGDGPRACLLIDENGNDYHLRAGKNVVGRSSQGDVCVDGYFRAVSRKHVIIEVTTGESVKLTDISSLGTFVPGDHLGARVH